MPTASGSRICGTWPQRWPTHDDDACLLGGRRHRRADGASRAAAQAARGSRGPDRLERTDRGCGRDGRRRRGGQRLVPAPAGLEGRDRVPGRARHPASRSGERARGLPGRTRRRTGAPMLATGRGRYRLLPHRACGFQRTATAVRKPVVVVLGASDQAPPPGIEPATGLAELRYAPDVEALARVISAAEALVFWRARKDWIEGTLPAATSLRWIQSASDGVD